MLHRFDLVVFDWDGTLFDSTAAIATAIQRAAADVGLPVPSRERASHVIGLGLSDALKVAVPDLQPEQVPAFVAAYRTHYIAAEPELALFDGAIALLDALAATGRPLAVATGKNRAGLDRVLQASGLAPRFGASRCADECHPKPHPAMLQELTAHFRVAPDRTLMIGDTTHDLDMAHAAGAAAIAVTQGAHDRAVLAARGPLAVCDTLADVQAVLLPAIGTGRG